MATFLRNRTYLMQCAGLQSYFLSEDAPATGGNSE